MKKLLMTIFILNFTLSISAQNGWTPVSKEQAEYNLLQEECHKIKNYYASISNEAWSSLNRKIARAMFQYLKKVGTPTSFKVLKDKITSGEISAAYLSQI